MRITVIFPVDVYIKIESIEQLNEVLKSIRDVRKANPTESVRVTVEIGSQV